VSYLLTDSVLCEACACTAEQKVKVSRVNLDELVEEAEELVRYFMQ
jgi:hypothetical protein